MSGGGRGEHPGVPPRGRRPGRALAALLPALIAALSCAGDEPAGEPAAAPPSGGRLVEVAEAAGIDFRHRHGGTGERYFPETMGSGGGFLDYDGDGRPDLYLVNGAATPGWEGEGPTNALYRNLGDGRFAERTAASGVGDPGYGFGVAFGDVDRDGDVDLYVTNLGVDALYENRGDGTFVDVTARAGLAVDRWSSSATFFDAEGDGDLDLYVVHYVDFTWETNEICGDSRLGILTYCHPDVYDGRADRLWLNRGDGSFEDASAALAKTPAEWTREGKGLGVVATDFDDDGDVDLYVANDSTANFLWRNRGDGTFEDVALLAGVAFEQGGRAEAGMGVDAGDVDGDGRLDLFVTNLDLETNTLYLNRGDGFFVDGGAAAGLAAPSYPFVGFGTRLADLDNDGDLDVLVVDGHIIDNIAAIRPDQTWAQPALLFRNRGDGTFEESAASWAPGLAEPAVRRGLALADVEGDGDLDVAVFRNDGPAELFRNDGAEERGWLRVRLVGSESNVHGYGARLVVETAGAVRVGEHRAASSFLSQSEDVVHFGLAGGGPPARLDVRWPSGRRQRLVGPPAGRLLVLHERGGGAR